jgi:hypothetical protein
MRNAFAAFSRLSPSLSLWTDMISSILADTGRISMNCWIYKHNCLRKLLDSIAIKASKLTCSISQNSIISFSIQ